MAERSYTTSDLSRRSGDIIAEALRHPVTLTQRNRPRLIVLNIEAYEEMRKRADPRRARTLESITDSELEEMKLALEKYAAETKDEK